MAGADDDIKRFRNLLVWAAEREQQEAESYELDLLELRETLTTRHYRRLSEMEIRQILYHRGKDTYALRREEGYIYLGSPRPFRTLPVLNAKWNFSNDNLELRLRLGLFHLGADAGPMASGFRFEMPEKAEAHRYCHAQPITELDVDETMPWLRADFPTSGPTFPLDARSLGQLLLTLLVSLYGATLVREASTAVPGLIDACRHLHFLGGVGAPA